MKITGRRFTGLFRRPVSC